MIRPLARRVALSAIVLVVPSTAIAQADRLSTTMSASLSQIYDANLFATPSSTAPQRDSITRLGPLFDLDYRSGRLFTTARYALQAERYANHPSLTSSTSHQDAGVALRYLMTQRLDASVDAGYVRTQTPSELNVESQLGVGRMPAERLSSTARIAYKWSDVTSVNTEYVFGRDRLIGVTSNAMHRVNIGVERNDGVRNTYRFDYESRNFETGARTWTVSHVMTARWTHRFTTRSGIDLTAGPRFSEGTLRPEISAAVRHQASHGDYSIRYDSTELTSFGEPGAIEVHRVSVAARYRPARTVSLTATPAVTADVRGNNRVTVVALELQSAFELSQRLSIVGWGRAGRQHGTLSGSPALIPYQTLGVTLKIAPPHASR
jgi:hypothetical protein